MFEIILVAIFALVIVGVMMAFMAVGIFFRGRCMRGNCGGEEIIGPDGEVLNCDTCPYRDEHEAGQPG